MQFIQKMKLIRKIQLSVFFIAAVSTMIAIVAFVELKNTDTNKELLFNEFLTPQKKINELYNRFKGIQFTLLKFSIPDFTSSTEENMKFISKEKAAIDTIFKYLQSQEFDPQVKTEIENVGKIWVNYKNVVVDAILSAALMQDLEMATVITTTSGEEISTQIESKFADVENSLNERGTTLGNNITDGTTRAITLIVIGMLVGAIAFGISVFIVAPTIVKPLKTFMQVLNSYVLGNYNVELNIKSQDEFGEMQKMLIKLKDAQLEKIKAAENISNGIFEKVNAASADDELAHHFNREIETFQEVISEITTLTDAAAQGNLKIRGNADNYQGDFKKIIQGVNNTLDGVIFPLQEGAEVLASMANGDLTVRVKGAYNGDLKLITDSINQVGESLCDALGQVNEAVSATASAANQISSSSEEMAAGAQEQSAQTSEVVAAIEEMTRTIMDNTKNASFAAETAKGAGDKARQGGNVVYETIDGMKRISHVVTSSAQTVAALGKSSDKIGEIVQVIDDIADQTNLLALNAAIEAARAGEQGRGFAVVADEVRKLAERTTKATKEIANMIKTIQKETLEAVKSMNQGTEEVEKGTALANKAGDVLKEIIEGAQKVTDVAVQVAAASEEQSNSSEQISRNVEGISNVTRETSTGINQIARAAEDLSRLTVNLQELVFKFKVSSNGHSLTAGKSRHGEKLLHHGRH
ncbi:MAG: methyl-accepting chemotaxis protein [Melioribacteraceae bacterium]|jgi:methyl-accepting chemotaxis protein|nr:methyl-accepting chemotaxis protein [Melioribacteraceae bacterium]